MAPWIPLFVISNLVYWAIFVFLAIRKHSPPAATTLGALHMLLAAALSVAPFRSFFDPRYPGFALGILRFEGRYATRPTAAMLAWALAAAWLLASRRSGSMLWVVVIGDVLFAINQLLGLTTSSAENDIQFGEYLTIHGVQALLIMAILFVVGPAISAWWAGTHVRQPAS